MTTRQEQVLVHLYGQLRSGNEYEMPYETTQDGIAEAIGISRGQVSIEMKRLESKGMVHRLQRHAYRDECLNRQHRRCYRLNPLGIATAQKILGSERGVA